jgi:hypothetical protein
MIEPSQEYPIQKHLPPVKIPLGIRLIGRMFAPIIRWRRDRKHRYLEKKILPVLLRDIKKCQSRRELEQLLGRPICVLAGKDGGSGYSPTGELIVPDIAEIYEAKGCHIDMWFKDNQIKEVYGSVRVSAWDAVVGLSAHVARAKRAKKHSKRLNSMSPHEEKEILEKPLSLETFRLFLDTYFLLDENETSRIPDLFKIIESSDKYTRLADLKEVLRKTEKVRKVYQGDTGIPLAVREFALLLASVDTEKREELLGPFLIPDDIELIEKHENLVEK